ncbi:MAG: cytidylate kinase-like family protein [Lachnospiraceae bacterium]|nr:cytidylate kinase-like family protein [Lachnospiraceae bacterium]
MLENYIVTIGRQYGSGGREIGKKLADRLEFAYYDTLLLENVAKNSGLSDAIISKYDEKLHDKWMSISLGMSAASDRHKLPVPLRAALGQFEEVEKIGRRGSAVIVGRCADQILKGRANILSVFIHADMELRVARVSERNQISEAEAKKRIKNTDKGRAAFYNYYTDAEWGKTDNYHLCIDSGVFGIDGTVTVLEACVNNRITPQK